MAADLEAYLTLKQEIEQIGRDMRAGQDKVLIGERIAKTLNQFESLLKAEAYKTMAKDIEPIDSNEPEIPSQVLAKRAGIPGTCQDCGLDQCGCFGHLPRPKILVRPDKLVKIEFDDSWTVTDRRMWLQAMKMALVKRRITK